MHKQEIHQHIAKLTEKIKHLNSAVSTGDEIHDVEIELLTAYHKELAVYIDKLTSYGAVETEDVENEIAADHTEEIKTESKPIVDEKQELEFHNQADYEPVNEKSDFEEQESSQEKQTSDYKEEVSQQDDDFIEEKESELTDQEAEVKTQEEIPFNHTEKQTKEPANADEDDNKEEKTEPALSEPEPVSEHEQKPDNIGIFREEPEQEDEMEHEQSPVQAENGNEPPPSLHERFMQSVQQSTVTGRIMHKPAKSLKECFDLNERFTFSKELFDGNMEYFESALKEIGSKSDKNEAKQFIQYRLAEKYEWTDKEQTVSKFVGMVETYFES